MDHKTARIRDTPQPNSPTNVQQQNYGSNQQQSNNGNQMQDYPANNGYNVNGAGGQGYGNGGLQNNQGYNAGNQNGYGGSGGNFDGQHGNGQSQTGYDNGQNVNYEAQRPVIHASTGYFASLPQQNAGYGSGEVNRNQQNQNNGGYGGNNVNTGGYGNNGGGQVRKWSMKMLESLCNILSFREISIAEALSDIILTWTRIAVSLSSFEIMWFWLI